MFTSVLCRNDEMFFSLFSQQYFTILMVWYLNHKSGCLIIRQNLRCVLLQKHHKSCECCPRHSLFKGHNVIVNIVVLNCQKCDQCLKCQVSGHKSLGLLFEGHVMSPHHSITLIRCLVLIVIIVLIVLIIIIVPVVIIVLIQ